MSMKRKQPERTCIEWTSEDEHENIELNYSYNKKGFNC